MLILTPSPDGRHSFSVEGPECYDGKMGGRVFECSELNEIPEYLQERTYDGITDTPYESYILTGSYNYMRGADAPVLPSSVPIPWAGMLGLSLVVVVMLMKMMQQVNLVAFGKSKC